MAGGAGEGGGSSPSTAAEAAPALNPRATAAASKVHRIDWNPLRAFIKQPPTLVEEEGFVP
ncbi:MAG: hypothetical protein NVSMB23_18990 [Myxococcales bacterium]